MNFEGKYHVAFEMTESHKLKRSLFPAPRDTNQRQNTHCHQYKSAYTGYGFFSQNSVTIGQDSCEDIRDSAGKKPFAQNNGKEILIFFIRQTLIFFNTEEVAPGSFGHRPFLLKPKPLLISTARIPWE